MSKRNWREDPEFTVPPEGIFYIRPTMNIGHIGCDQQNNPILSVFDKEINKWRKLSRVGWVEIKEAHSRSLKYSLVEKVLMKEGLPIPPKQEDLDYQNKINNG